MTAINVSTEITSPPEAVFAVFADVPRAADHVSSIKRIELLTDGPIGAGSRFRETRIMFGREATEEMEIASFEPPRAYSVEGASCGMRWQTTFTFSPIGTGTTDATRVDVAFEMTPMSTFAKVMAVLCGWMMTRPMRRCIESDLADLKRVCETAPHTADVPSA